MLVWLSAVWVNLVWHGMKWYVEVRKSVCAIAQEHSIVIIWYEFVLTRVWCIVLLIAKVW